jgi:hypothetical protein
MARTLKELLLPHRHLESSIDRTQCALSQSHLWITQKFSIIQKLALILRSAIAR